MINPVIKLAAIALAATAVTASAALAQVKLPPTVTMTAYDTGTSGFNITVAIGKMLKDKYGSDVRVLPAGNDVARLQPLRVGRAAISAMGAGVYFAQEGVFEFATREWGPQAGPDHAELGRLQRPVAGGRRRHRRQDRSRT